MQCGCPQCGILMGQVVKGLDSYCQCPECGAECRDCLGRSNGFSTFIPTREEAKRLNEKKVQIKSHNIIKKQGDK